MKLPGTFKRLKEQLDEIGYQIFGELKFDSEGNVVGLPIRPAPPAPTAADSKQPGTPRGPRRSPTEMFLGGPQ